MDAKLTVPLLAPPPLMRDDIALHDWRRRRTRDAFVARHRRDEPFVPGPSPDTIAFWAAVRKLPTRPRLVVTLHDAGDHAVVDVARILDVPEGTVRSDLTRARVVLTQQLGVTR